MAVVLFMSAIKSDDSIFVYPSVNEHRQQIPFANHTTHRILCQTVKISEDELLE
jgi:hypothetical protein